MDNVYTAPNAMVDADAKSPRGSVVANGVLFAIPVLTILIATAFAEGWAAAPIALAVGLGAVTSFFGDLLDRPEHNSDHDARTFLVSWLAYSFFFIARDLDFGEADEMGGFIRNISGASDRCPNDLCCETDRRKGSPCDIR